MSINRRVVAREWLLLLGLVALGLIVPWAIGLVSFGRLPPEDWVNKRYDAVWEGENDAVLAVLAPYLICQLTRSLVWAYRVVRSPSA